MIVRIATLIAFIFSAGILYSQQISLSGKYGFTDSEKFPSVYGVKAGLGGYLYDNFYAEVNLGFNYFFEATRGEPPHDNLFIANYRRTYFFGLSLLYNIYQPPGPGRIMLGLGGGAHFIEYPLLFNETTLVFGSDISVPLVYRVDRFGNSRWGAYIGTSGNWVLMQELNDYYHYLDPSHFFGLNILAGVIFQITAVDRE